MDDVKDSRTLVNSKRIEHHSELFLEKLENCSKTNQREILIELGYRKRRKYKVRRENLKAIVNYANCLRANGICKITSISRIANILIYFADFVRKPFKSVKEEDIERFFEKYINYSNSYQTWLKRVIKPFFKWLYGYREKHRYPKVVKWITCSKKSNSGKLPDILTLEEVQRMIEVCDNYRDKALISVLYESACRASEILDLKIGDLKEDEYGMVVVVNGKTGSRRIRLISSVGDLKAWLNVHPRKNEPDAPLFCSLKAGIGRPLGNNTLGFTLSKLAKRAKIQKRVFPHLFRHSRLTELAKYMTEQELKVYAGWRPNSDMAQTYVHLSGADIDKKILAINGIKSDENKRLPTIPTLKCYRCGEFNNVGNKFCWKCNAPLTQETIEKIEIVKKIVSEVTMFIFEKMKEKKIGEEDLEEIIKEWYKKSGS